MTKAYYSHLEHLSAAEQSYRWRNFLTSPPKVIAVDTETPDLNDRSLLGLSPAWSRNEATYITADDPDFPQLIRILADPAIRKVYHNAPYDLRVLREYGTDLTNLDDTAVMCRMLMIPARLEDAAIEVWREAWSTTQLFHQYSINNMMNLPFEVLAHKCCTDATVTYALWEELLPRVDPEYYAVEREIVGMLETISQKGIALDQDRMEEIFRYYNREFSWLKEIGNGMGFNPGSGKQVGIVLSGMHEFLPMTDGKKQLATDDATLKKSIKSDEGIAIASMVLLYRHLQKMLSTYIKPLRGKERAYTTLHMDAITGRISSTSAGNQNPDRNLQNIPKRAEKGFAPSIRSAFVPNGYHLGAHNGLNSDVFTFMDASQIELRILAHMSQDVRMLAVFERGGDIHADTELAIWGTHGTMRLWAKIFNFAMFYGADPETVAAHIDSRDIKGTAAKMKLWLDTYSGAAQWMLDQQQMGMEQGYVETLYGRKIPVPFEESEKHGRNCSINYPIQGTAAEIFKRIMVACKPILEFIQLQIHDELMFSERLVLPSGLDQIAPFHTPLEVEYHTRWGEKE